MASSIHQNIRKRSKNLSIHFSPSYPSPIIKNIFPRDVFPVFYTTWKHREQYLRIFQIAATNIIISTAGLSSKYNNQMVRNTKPALACYENTISTSSNLKNLFFSSIIFKTSINRLTCENTFSVIVIFLHKISFKSYVWKTNVLI